MLPRLAATLLVLGLASPARAEDRPAFRLMEPGQLGALARREAEGEAGSLEGGTSDAQPLPLTPARHLTARTWRLAGTFSAGVVAGGYVLWWRRRPIGDFDHWSEGWFGENTYSGGADKTSHLVLGYIGGRFLQERLEKMGHAGSRARLLSVGMVSAAGLLVEVGDGFTQYRFSWEDAVITSAGGAFGALVDAGGLGDTLGMRFGRVPTQKPDRQEGSQGSTAYHHTIDTLDVHLSGLLPRMGVKPGAFRFLMVSGTYSARGYGFVDTPYRQRLVGVEVGLDVAGILRAAGVREETWWGGPLLFFTRFFRLPWTAIGVRYDLNDGRWLGPDFGDRYSP